MRRWMIFGMAAVLMAASVGCKKRPVDEKAATEEAQQNALMVAQAEQTKALDEIRAEIVTWRNTAAAQAAEPEFKDDLAVAKRLTGMLSRQASKQQDKEAALTVDRLARCLSALSAGAPANRIQQHLERAEMGLVSGNLEAAGAEVLAAAGTAYNPSAPALVPDVLGQLEDASKAVRNGDAAKAEELIGAVMEKARADAASADLATAQDIAAEAEVSIQRKAWTILIAQATQITALLQAVDRRATPEAQPAAESPAPAAAPPTEPPAAPTPAPAETKQPGAPPATEGAGAPAPKANEAAPEPAATR